MQCDAQSLRSPPWRLPLAMLRFSRAWSTDDDMGHSFVAPLIVLWIVWRRVIAGNRGPRGQAHGAYRSSRSRLLAVAYNQATLPLQLLASRLAAPSCGRPESA